MLQQDLVSDWHHCRISYMSDPTCHHKDLSRTLLRPAAVADVDGHAAKYLQEWRIYRHAQRKIYAEGRLGESDGTEASLTEALCYDSWPIQYSAGCE